MSRLSVGGGQLLLEGWAVSNIGLNAYSLLEKKWSNRSGGETAYIQDWALMAQYGVKFVRVNIAPFWSGGTGQWLDIVGSTVPSKAGYYTDVEALMNAAAAAGIYVLPTLFWRWATIPDLKGESVSVGFGSANSATRAYMAAFATEFATRYRNHPALGAYIISNEWNLKAWDGNIPTVLTPQTPPSYSSPADVTPWQGVRDTLQVVASAIRSVDPDAAIVSGFGGPPLADQQDRPDMSEWVDRQLALHPPAVNVIDTHLYPTNASMGRFHDSGERRSVRTMRDYLSELNARAGQMGKALIMTEFGCTDAQNPDGRLFDEMITETKEAGVGIALVWNWNEDFVASQVDWHIYPGSPRAGYLESIRRANLSTHSRRGGRPSRYKSPPQKFCAHFDGANSFMTAPSHPAIDGAVDWSLVFWIRPHEQPGTFRRVWEKTAVGNPGGMQLLFDSAGKFIYTNHYQAGGTNAYNTAGQLRRMSPGQWRHCAITFNASNSNVRTYLDGEYWKSETLSPTSPSMGGAGHTQVFGRSIGGIGHARFDMADFMMFPRMLSHGEVLDHVRNGQAPDLPAVRYKFDGDGQDSGPNGLHGTPSRVVFREVGRG